MNTPWGLVLAGGKSERMGQDKGRLVYHDRPHRLWLADLLAESCERAFISVGQAEDGDPGDGHAYIADLAGFAGNGPIGALLSANAVHPGRSWLVVSCDLPFFDRGTVNALLANRDPALFATAFLNPANGQPEPLVTIYEPAFMDALPGWFANGDRSMRRIMGRVGTRLIRDFEPRWLVSADTPEGYAEAARALRGGQSAA